MNATSKIGLAIALAAIAGPALSAINQTFTFNDSTAPQAVDRMFRDGVPATCATPGTPALVGSVSNYSFQTQTFFNNGPGRCVTVTVTAATCTGPNNFIGVNAYSPTVSAPTRTGVTWVGDGGISPNPSTTFSFNAPANAPIVFWIDRILPVGTLGLVNCDYTIQSAELDAVAVVAVVTPIPTLSELALALLATLLAASAIYMTRGRMRR